MTTPKTSKNIIQRQDYQSHTHVMSGNMHMLILCLYSVLTYTDMLRLRGKQKFPCRTASSRNQESVQKFSPVVVTPLVKDV